MKKTLKNKATILSKNLFPVVGIGASAGGLEAFKKLIKSIPEKSGMAYILVQHLHPDHGSALPQILQRETRIPVHEISNNVEVVPDNIYIIPANKMLAANDGILKLSPRPDDQKNMPIDIFFTSLAAVHQSHAIGIVLSGNGSDGTSGLKNIKDQGGITFAQEPKNAAYGDMPQSAIDAGVVDFILVPEKMPQRLLELDKTINKAFPAAAPATPEELTEEESYRQVLSLLRQRKGIDFNYYKQTTIRRRMLRRMALLQIKKIIDYQDYLKQNKQEMELLFKDILIPVTEFFRDPKTFEYLCNSLFPELIKNKRASTLRIWIAGCSTGEEAYSIAICLYECLNENDSDVKIQIFATDISEESIASARTGIYTNRQLEGVSDSRVQQFFTRLDGHYHVKKIIRDMCVFATHNFLKDPPFAKIDFISCRNVLIYMEPILQKKALTTFHYALNEKGYLLLGKSETVATTDLFNATENKEKLFTRKSVPGRFMNVTSERREEGLKDNDYTIRSNEQKKDDFQKNADDILLLKFTPAAVIVDEQFDIVQFRGKTGAFLEPSPGKASLNVLKMAREGLSFEIRNGLHRAKASNETFIKEGIPILSGEKLVTIEVIPLLNTIDLHFLILFGEEKSTGNGQRAASNKQGDTKDARIAQLERELLRAREDMRSITEDQEAANEELQSANEELLSGSEELQTLNEELETSKEELQSTNEELITVNQELFDRNEMYNHARLYAEAIVSTVHEPLLVLTKDFRVKSANASFYKTFHLTEENTLGKILFELENKGWDIPDLRSQLLKIQTQKEKSLQWELTYNFPTVGNRTIMFNARPVQKENNESWVLLAMEDITERAQFQFDRDELLNKFQNLMEQAPVAIAILSGKEYMVELANDFYLQLVGKQKDFIGRPLFESIPELETQVIKELLDEVMRTGKPYYGNEVELHLAWENKNKRGYYNFVYQPVIEKDKSISGVMVVAIEVTEQVAARKKIEESEKRLNTLVHSSPFAIGLLRGQELKITTANEAIIKILGKGPDIIGKSYFELMPELAEQGYREVFSEVYATGKPFNAVETPVNIMRNGKMDCQYYNFLLYAQRNADNEINGIGIIASEVTQLATYHQNLKENEERFRVMADLMPAKVTTAKPDGGVTYYNKAWLDYTGMSLEELKGFGYHKIMHPDELEVFQKRLQQAGETGTVMEMEMRFMNMEGNYKWHLNRAFPLMDADGKIKMWIGATTDIQEQKRREEEKNEFISIASHELKTPLTTSKLYIHLLYENLTGKGIQKKETHDQNLMFVQKAGKSIEKLQLLIAELLDVSKIQLGKLDLNLTTFDFNEMLDDAIEDVQISTNDFTFLKEGVIAKPFQGDKDRLQQVIINLLTNAVKYSPESDKVFITVTEDDIMIKVAVKDQGVGIKKENLKKVFDLYYREENSHPFQGFGIGLSIASEIVHRHDGVIWAESDPGKGTTVYFTLPKKGIGWKVL